MSWRNRGLFTFALVAVAALYFLASHESQEAVQRHKAETVKQMAAMVAMRQEAGYRARQEVSDELR